MASLRSGIRRIAHLLEQLLAFARYDQAPSAVMPEEAFDRIVKEVVADLLPVAQDLAIDLGFTRIDPAPVRAEPLALAMLVRNLIDSAIKYMPAGGRIDVILETRDDLVVFQVEDSGTGVSPQDIARIFEPFFRGLRPRGDGTGLGLSIVQRIVERCGGTIQVENGTTAVGLTVRLTLPRAKKQSDNSDVR